ncbi:hypothetical protein OS493_039241 [Desmophyllum pertusum]|uniref:Uncharacterized protein n=1 Tax=Desmophyllum pertusum TaxID=174260 RepID=A0A9X0CZK5_9CNID|nr:hypothetical protein OS493_039241 [Desmophyllum pertusum]
MDTSRLLLTHKCEQIRHQELRIQVKCGLLMSVDDTHGTSSAKEQVDTELTSPRRKRAKNEEDCKQLRSCMKKKSWKAVELPFQSTRPTECVARVKDTK